MFTPRAYLRCAFSRPEETAIEVSRRFVLNGRPASSRFVTDCKFSVASDLLQEAQDFFATVHAPCIRMPYAVSSMQVDEASFECSGLGETAKDNPI